MSALVTRIETRTGRQLAPEQIFEIQRAREVALSRLLILYVVTGLAFMLLPGTFLGVWNLISISNRHAAQSVFPAWIQAHGHAQIMGWIGTFILGIGFYSIPKLRRMEPFALGVCGVTWALWTTGVGLRWVANVYQWHWRLLLPVSGVLELLGFALFFHSVSGHKRAENSGSRIRFEVWVLVVIIASIGFMGMLLTNAGACLYVAFHGASPAFPPGLDQRFLVLSSWGFMVPFVWGFSAKWLPVFLGLKPVRTRILLAAVAVNAAGVVLALSGWFVPAAQFLIAASVLVVVALRLFEATQQAAKVGGVHSSFPFFVRAAYIWLMVAAVLGIWASAAASTGVWGASRHALTVGFIATMVFSIGQRVLPAFSGMRMLFSPRLMLASLALLTAGCILRVGSEVIAYQGYFQWAWSVLPVSALTELAAVTVFAVNMIATFVRPPALQIAKAA
jgi:uncharacterized protein involved in response to NO